MPDLGGDDQEVPDPEGDLSAGLDDDFLKPDLPGKSGRVEKVTARALGDQAPKRRSRSRTTTSQAVPGAPLVGSNVEEVWDDDPTVLDLPEENEEEDEGSEESGKRVKKKRKRDAEQPWGWGQKTTLWWLLSGVSAVLVIGYILQEDDRARSPAAVVEEPERFVSTVSLEETPVSQLLLLGQSAVSQLVEILQKVEASPEDAADLVVGGGETLVKMEGWRRKMGEKAAVKEDGVIGLMAAGRGDRGYLLMSGLRNDYTKYIAYFVEIDGGLRLDWEATEGFSRLLPEELISLKAGEEIELRTVVSASSFYTTLYPEEVYACILLSHVDRESYAWGYIRRDSPDYERLVNELSSPVAALTSGRAILRVAGGIEGGLPKQVLVAGVVAADWLEVLPVVEDEVGPSLEEKVE